MLLISTELIRLVIVNADSAERVKKSSQLPGIMRNDFLQDSSFINKKRTTLNKYALLLVLQMIENKISGLQTKFNKVAPNSIFIYYWPHIIEICLMINVLSSSKQKDLFWKVFSEFICREIVHQHCL